MRKKLLGLLIGLITCSGETYAADPFEGILKDLNAEINDKFRSEYWDKEDALKIFFQSQKNTATLFSSLNSGLPIPSVCTPSGALNFPMPAVFTNLTFGSINFTNNSIYYTDLTSTVSTELLAGNTYNFKLGGEGLNTGYFEVFIDYDNNGVFESSESVANNLSLAGSGNIYPYIPTTYYTTATNITIPTTAIVETPLRMRVVTRNQANSIGSCPTTQTNYGHDFTVVIKEVYGCSNIPENIPVMISSTEGTINTNFSLQVPNLIYSLTSQSQWQKSSDGLIWEDINGATNFVYAGIVSGEINSTNYYRYRLICDGNTTYSNTVEQIVREDFRPITANCVPSRRTGNSETGINLVKFGTINNASDFLSLYTDYTPLAHNSNFKTEVNPGGQYEMTLGTNSTKATKFNVYIDYNNNGILEANERAVTDLVVNATETSVLKSVTATIRIPDNVALNSKLRLRVIGDLTNSTNGSCDNRLAGEVEDYVILTKQLIGCSTFYNDFSATISNQIVLNNSSVTINSSGFIQGTTTQYQWQSSIDGAIWENIDNAITRSYTTAVIGNFGERKYFRLRAICNGITRFSIPIYYEISGGSYCGISILQGWNSERIGNVKFSDINNYSYNTSKNIGYEDFSHVVGNVFRGETYSFSATANGISYTDYSKVRIWIDYNQDMQFSNNELVGEIDGSNGRHPWNTSITISPLAIVGKTRIRIRVFDYRNVGDPCGYTQFGETEDYTLDIKDPLETIWNGNSWSNGVPNELKKATIRGNINLPLNLVAKEFIVESGNVNINDGIKVTSDFSSPALGLSTGKIVVKSGSSLSVNHSIINELSADKFEVQHDANLIQGNEVTNLGDITVIQNSQNMVRNDMTFWSSPVSNLNVRNFSPETLQNRFWTYNEQADGFQEIFNLNAGSRTFNTGEGVAIRVSNLLPTGERAKHTGKFIGVPNNGNVNYTVTNDNNGYNLIGNPYASTLKVTDFLAENQHINSLYFWTHQYPVGHAQFDQNFAAFSIAGSVIPLSLDYLSKGQGFIVGVNSDDPIVFNNSMRTFDQSLFYRNEFERNRVWLSLNNASGNLSQILLAYMTGATNEFDHQIDTRLMKEGTSTISTLIDNQAYAIQGRALPFEANDRVRLGFTANQTGEYSIAIEAKDGLFAQNQNVFLYDSYLNQEHDLNDGAYQFESEQGIFNDRFEMVYERTLKTNDLELENDIKAYTNKKEIIIVSTNSLLHSIKLYDLEGKLLAQKSNIKLSKTSFKATNNGIYLLEVKTNKGKISVKKIIIK